MQDGINIQALQKIQADIAIYTTPTKPIKLVVATKYASIAQMLALYDAGIRCFGENRIQDALAKKHTLPVEIANSIEWHFIGHLQQNKVNKTFFQTHSQVERASHEFTLLHSIDSLELAERVSVANIGRELCQGVLIQVNQAMEAEKSGFLPAELEHVIAHVLTLKGLQVHGLMAFGHPSMDAEACKVVFSAVSEHAKRLSDTFQHEFSILSMGMSQDYLPALQKGATIIRVGRQLFKEQ